MQEEIAVLVIEDDEMWIKTLSASLDDLGFHVAAVASTFETAVIALNNTDFDIALLDINLHGQNVGIELGKMLTNLYRKPFIFITASYDKHTLNDAIQAKPSAYLTKPVNSVSLFVTIQTAINNFDNQVVATGLAPSAESDSFFVKQGNKCRRISWKDVVYLSSDKKYTGLFNAPDKTEYLIRSTLSKTLQHIVPKHLQGKFIQLNRSEVINIDYLQEFSADEAKTVYKNFIVTDAYSKDLKTRLNIVS